MKIDTLVVGPLETNCYIATLNGKSFIVDPGDEAKRIIDFCKNLDVVEIIITHHHFDHTGALREIEEYFNLKENVKSPYFDYEIINTPGHTSDSRSIYFPKEHILFSGDFIFKNAIGRTDLDTGSDVEMINSLKLISKYPKDTIVYPGHGPETILGDELYF